MATKKATNRFYYNGVKKVGSDLLTKVRYSFSKAFDATPAHLTIYAREYNDSLNGLAGYRINQSDSRADYYEKDRVVLMDGMSDYLPALQAAKKYYKRLKDSDGLVQIDEELARLTSLEP